MKKKTNGWDQKSFVRSTKPVKFTRQDRHNVDVLYRAVCNAAADGYKVNIPGREGGRHGHQ